MPGDRQLMRQELYRLAADQVGYFTAAQAIEIGYSHQSQKYHVDRGNWTRVDRGIFRIPEWPTGPHDSLMRWVLWSKQRAVVSHDTAASAYNLGLLNPADIHLTVPPDFRMMDDYVTLHHRYLPENDRTRLDGIPVTTVLRTVVDIIETHFDDELVETVVRDALDRGMVSHRQLARRVEEMAPEASDRGRRILAGASS